MNMKGGGQILFAGIISIILGALPSFLFFSVFNQSNFSLSRYLNFLSNTNSSLASWISIFIITLIVYFIMVTLQSKKKKAFVIFFIVFLSLGFTILYLYANFLLGNDILVKLSANKENIFFYDNSTQNLVFTISAFMNPFCVAQCQYSLFDISAGKTIDSAGFSTTSILSNSKEYLFVKEGHPQGQVLNRFEVRCKSKKTLLCYTDEEESKRAMLITLNYDFSPEQKIANEISKKEIISLEKTLYNLSNGLNETDSKIKAMNNSLYVEDLLLQALNFSNGLFNLNASLEYAKQLWKSREYSRFELEFPAIKSKISNFEIEENSFILLINSNLSLYNGLIINLSNLRISIKQIPLENLSENSCKDLNNLIANFNETVKNFKEKSNLSYKETLVESVTSEFNNFSESRGEEVTLPCTLSNIITEENLSVIDTVIENYTIPEFYLEDPVPVCCFYGKCEPCLNETHYDKNYPVIFLHGHSLNKALSADYSLDVFGKIKDKLTGEGYIDAGAIIISQSNEQNGLWGKVNATIEVTGSNFFDVSKNETGGETIISSKREGIDTYAIRLNELINTVKDRTGKDKVVVVAHSMGGLVTRRYIQIFGEENLDKIILVTIPNHGIESQIKDYCSLIGSEKECEDMDENSLLINKLDNAPNITVPVYNIIGRGCYTYNPGNNGDGIVKESSQYLEYVINQYVEGSCDELKFNFLHKEILDPEKYPQAYEFIKEDLKGNLTIEILE